MKHLLIGSMILLTNCAFAVPPNNPENVTQSLSYCDLTKNPSAFSGKRIRVRAIYSYMFEVSRLKPPACCTGGDTAIWVDFSEEMDGNSTRLFRKFPRGMGFVLATFEGVFQSGGPFGDGGYRYRLAVDKIEALEKKANPSPAHRPAWIPNCEASSAAPAERS
jgi:hypothetical protein